MKAFTVSFQTISLFSNSEVPLKMTEIFCPQTACALIGASASADSQFYTAPRLHGAGVIPQTVVPVYGPYAAATTAYTTGAAASVVPTVGYVAPAVAAIRYVLSILFLSKKFPFFEANHLSQSKSHSYTI